MGTPVLSLNNMPTRPERHKPNGSAPSRPGGEPVPRGAAFPNGGTYIGRSLLIKGEVSGSEPLHVEGRIEGSISLPGGHVCIGRDGVAAASVEAAEVVVRGKLQGNLKASGRLELHNGASAVGEMAAPRIRIEDGAQLQGKIDTPRPGPASQPQVETSAAVAREEQDSSHPNEAQPSPALATNGDMSWQSFER
jgi:cytoskeletal protein CcmA (bactofilin family)